MKKYNKLIGLLLSLVLAINISAGVSYTKVDAASNVAYVWLVSCTKGLGHSFLVVKNTSSSKITVGKMSLSPGKILTVGTFGNLEDGQCLYYNVEKYRMVNNYCDYTPNKYLGEYITSSELSTLTSTINSNTKWTASNNCAGFAATCWNSFSDRTVSSKIIVIGSQVYASPIADPGYLSINIEQHSGSSNFSMDATCGTSDVKYQSSSSASLKTCSLVTMDLLTSSSATSSN